VVHWATAVSTNVPCTSCDLVAPVHSGHCGGQEPMMTNKILSTMLETETVNGRRYATTYLWTLNTAIAWNVWPHLTPQIQCTCITYFPVQVPSTSVNNFCLTVFSKLGPKYRGWSRMSWLKLTCNKRHRYVITIQFHLTSQKCTYNMKAGGGHQLHTIQFTYYSWTVTSHSLTH